MTTQDNLNKLTLRSSLAGNHKGATLIELLISLAILSIISVAFLNVITGSIRLRADSDLTKRASALASSKVEVIKGSDTLPSELVVTETTGDGFTVTTSYVEKTTDLNLTAVSLPQKDLSFYQTPVFELNFAEQLTGNYLGTAITPLDYVVLTDFNFTLRIRAVEGSTSLLAYELLVNTTTGQRHINVGSQTLSESIYKPAVIKVSDKFTNNVNLNVEDLVGEHIQIGIFDDKLNRIQTQISGTNPAVRVEGGLITDGAANQLALHYYDVLVSVTKNGREYARVLTTWAVGQ